MRLRSSVTKLLFRSSPASGSPKNSSIFCSTRLPNFLFFSAVVMESIIPYLRILGLRKWGPSSASPLPLRPTRSFIPRRRGGGAGSGRIGGSIGTRPSRGHTRLGFAGRAPLGLRQGEAPEAKLSLLRGRLAVEVPSRIRGFWRADLSVYR